jgi:hypothetical protein
MLKVALPTGWLFSRATSGCTQIQHFAYRDWNRLYLTRCDGWTLTTFSRCELEKQTRHLNAWERLTLRENQSRPIIDKLEAWSRCLCSTDTDAGHPLVR